MIGKLKKCQSCKKSSGKEEIEMGILSQREKDVDTKAFLGIPFYQNLALLQMVKNSILAQANMGNMG